MKVWWASMGAIFCVLAAGAASREQIYVARSVTRLRENVGEACAAGRTGFKTATQTLSSLHSMSIDAADGRVTNTDAGGIGELRFCTGSGAKPGELSFYGEGQIAGISLHGRGLCVVRVATPAAGLTSLRCYLELSGLPDGYVGGVLTSNSLTSGNATGGDTDPPGYTQTSIVTIRLWQKQ